jgi:hypothetical protein
MWDHEIWDHGYEWWRNVLQGLGALVGGAVGFLSSRDMLVLVVIGAVYGSLFAGSSYQLRGIVRGERAKALLPFFGYLGATAGFTYFFFLSGTDCGIVRLLLSPVYAIVGWVVGAGVGWAANHI